MTPSRLQSAVIDLLKIIASQAIVIHHLAGYGPTSLALEQHFPALSHWLVEYAGMAVQVFLVIAGFLAAQTVSQRRDEFQNFPWRPILARYRRLVLPYSAALLLAILIASFARPWFDAEFIPDPPRPAELLSHLTLTHVAFDHPALSTGVWYVAIDLQLFTLFALLAWLGSVVEQRAQASGRNSTHLRHTMLMVAVLGTSSLLVFNRNQALDGWAIYFFGSYAMGAIVCWAQSMPHQHRWLVTMTLVGGLALLVDFRWRPALALLTALALWLAGNWQPPINAVIRRALAPGPIRLVRYLAAISYALFLVHFPVMMMISTVFAVLDLNSAQAGLMAAALTWLLSIIAADLLHRHVELRIGAPRRQLA
jgi:peptidoglycan/LPS O-acetylase OafA/YrhL